MATIYGFKNFNNYYNRIVKGQNINNINDFTSTYGDYDYCQTSTVDNFNESDGVFTTHILGVQNNPYFGDCSYILVCRDNINIDSKWFIVDQNFKCYGQYQLSLYRDVITENWNNIINADAFIERGIVSDDSPFIYNMENITTNKIKKQEILLRDKYWCAWAVGYIAKNTTAQNLTLKMDTIPDYTVNTYNTIATTIGATANTDYKSCVQEGGYDKVNYSFEVVGRYKEGIFWHYNQWKIYFNRQTNKWLKEAIIRTTIPGNAYTCLDSDVNNIISDLNDIKSTLYTSLSSHTTIPHNSTEINKIKSYSGSIFKTTDTSKFYKINSNYLDNQSSSLLQDGDTTDPTDPIVTIRSILEDYQTGGNLPTKYYYQYNYNYDYYNITNVVQGEYTVRIPDAGTGVGNRLSCKECFDMFVMPIPVGFNTLTINNINDFRFISFDTNASTQLAFAQQIAQQLGSNLYDLQLLPYCPLTGITANYYFDEDTNYIDLTYQPSDQSTDPDNPYVQYGVTPRYSVIRSSSNTGAGILIWCASNTGSFNLYENGLTLTNKKMQNQTQTIRFSSPNYASQFDCNIAKNNGIRTINVDYTYLPYQPYIHLSPIFNGLYGGEYNDARGLILSGDFSISYTKDEWKQYQINNKNYDNIFNRQTQTLELQHKQQRIQTIAGAIVGSAQGGVVGGMIGGPLGVGLGLAGAGLSAVGGAIDYKMQEEMYKENMSARRDIYEMQLDNIQALPNSLTKVTSINENNKYFPFIEIYDCTDEEKIAVANYIRSNGMTIGVYGNLSDYINNSWSYDGIEDRGFVKANLIKIDGIEDDTHIINAINNELNKGVYTK